MQQVSSKVDLKKFIERVSEVLHTRQLHGEGDDGITVVTVVIPR